MKSRTEIFVGSLLFLTTILTLFSWKGQKQYFLVLIGVNWLAILLTIKGFDRFFFGEVLFERDREEKIHLFLGSLVFCSLIDFFGVYVSRLWYYPETDFFLYLLLAPIGFFVYTQIMFLLYESFEKKFEPIQSIKDLNLTPHYDLVMKTELLTGVLGILTTLMYSLHLITSIEIGFTQITSPGTFTVSWWFPLIILPSFTLLFEFLSYENDRETLTLNILNGNLYPIFGFILCSFIGIVLIELVNLPFGAWKFANWPFGDIKMLGLPAMVYITWPLQFPAFLAIFRNLYPKKEKIW